MTDGTNITTTQYLDGLPYVEDVLQFFPTPEGYVSHGDNGFYYVYNSIDHLDFRTKSFSEALSEETRAKRSVRLSYKDNGGNLETLEEIEERNSRIPSEK